MDTYRREEIVSLVQSIHHTMRQYLITLPTPKQPTNNPIYAHNDSREHSIAIKRMIPQSDATVIKPELL